MRNGEGADAARAASGGGVPAPDHEPSQDDHLLRRGRLGVAGYSSDEIQLSARQPLIALKAKMTGRSPIGELLRGWVRRPRAGGRHQELFPG
jgi:hypothetical protein